MSKVLGIITARGGSKGIPGKNIKALLGRPLIAYTIDAAKDSGVLDRIIVSTDDAAIADVAKACGAEVPFLRPSELAGDAVQHLPVVRHAVEWLKEHEAYEPEYVMILQPTSPLRQAGHIKEAVELIRRTGADSVVSVSEIPESFHPHNAMMAGEGGFLTLANGNPISKRIPRRQDRPPRYWSIGSIYLFRTPLLFHPEEPSFYGEKVAPYVVDKKYVVDINTPEDWEMAEKALKKILNSR